MAKRDRASSVRGVPKELTEAARRVGDGPEQQARWLLHFAWSELGRSSSVAWELQAFMWFGSQYESWARKHPGHPAHQPPGWACKSDEVTQCQEILREGLRSLVYEGRWPLPVPETIQDFQWMGPPWHKPTGLWHGTLNCVPVQPRLSLKVAPDSAARRLEHDTGGLFRLRVYETLRDAALRFRVCERERCYKPFIARKRQAYCSRRCSQAVRTRKFRRRHPERVRTLQRRRYEGIVRARAGQSVKIATRQLRKPVVAAPTADVPDAAWRPRWMIKPTHWWQETHERNRGRDRGSGRK
jgi:hypothetical protein